MSKYIFLIFSLILLFQNSFAGYSEDSIEVDVSFSTVILPAVVFENSTVTFSKITPGDTLSGSINVTLFGSSARSFSCDINGSGLEGIIDFFDSKLSLTLQLNGCSPSSIGTFQTISITSPSFPSNINPSSTDTQTVTLSISYQAETIDNYI